MLVTVNRKPFLNGFLSPLNKISDRGIFSIKTDGVECLTCSVFDKKEQTIILYVKYNDEISLENVNEIKLNIPSIPKLMSAFSFLNEDKITLAIDNNSISYKSPNSKVSFRYHLLEDGILENPTVNMQNVYSMGFDFECSITNEILKTIFKTASFADQANKIYIFTKSEKVMGLITDETIKNIDSIELDLADEFSGLDIKKKIPISLEIFRILSTLPFNEIKMKINIERGIIMFEAKTEEFLLQYIVTALIK